MDIKIKINGKDTILDTGYSPHLSHEDALRLAAQAALGGRVWVEHPYFYWGNHPVVIVNGKPWEKGDKDILIQEGLDITVESGDAVSIQTLFGKIDNGFS
jgi:hypothetical protein